MFFLEKTTRRQTFENVFLDRSLTETRQISDGNDSFQSIKCPAHSLRSISHNLKIFYVMAARLYIRERT